MSAPVFQLVSSAVKEFDVVASENQKKKYSFDFDTLLPNVLIGMNVNFGDEGTDKQITSSNKASYVYTAKKNGNIRLFAALKPKFIKQVVDKNGGIYLYYAFGHTDGTGKDFIGDMGAMLEITFFTETYDNSQYKHYTGAKTSINSNPFTINSEGKSWLLPDSHMDTAMLNHTSCRIDVIKDSSNPGAKWMLEKEVVIHVLDKNGNLLFIYDKDSGHDNIVYYKNTGMQILCLINVASSGTASRTELDYKIGDPKTDAKIIVTEVDV